LLFMTRDYRASCFWFEVLEFGKKFVLTGALMRADAGSNTQLLIGMLVSLVFFAIVVRKMPFKSSLHNFIRATTEITLFVTLLCLLVLRLDMHDHEWLTESHVAWIILGGNFVLAQLPILCDLAVRGCRFACNVYSAYRMAVDAHSKQGRFNSTARASTVNSENAPVVTRSEEASEEDSDFSLVPVDYSVEVGGPHIAHIPHVPDATWKIPEPQNGGSGRPSSRRASVGAVTVPRSELSARHPRHDELNHERRVGAEHATTRVPQPSP
jgi:hypothetical protein